MITGGHPWAIATTEDENFCNFIKYGETFFHAYGISQGASAILQNLFFLDPKSRINLKRLRKMIVKLDTFYLSDEDMAQINDRLQLYYYGCDEGRELPYQGPGKEVCGNAADNDQMLFWMAQNLELNMAADSQIGRAHV